MAKLRRKFSRLRHGAAAASLQRGDRTDEPEIRWRLAASCRIARYASADATFPASASPRSPTTGPIQPFAAGEIVPGLPVLDAVRTAQSSIGNTALYYYWGKDPAFTFATSLTSVSTGQMSSWLR